MDEARRDPVVSWLLRYQTQLREGGLPSEHEVLATYWSSQGKAVFAFCRHGLLLRPGADERYFPYAEIADAGYYDREMILRAKAAKVAGGSRPLGIRLDSGELIELQVEVQPDGMPDLLNIARLIHRRAVLHRRGSAPSQ
jgi:hypothetical protein